MAGHGQTVAGRMPGKTPYGALLRQLGLQLPGGHVPDLHGLPGGEGEAFSPCVKSQEVGV